MPNFYNIYFLIIFYFLKLNQYVYLQLSPLSPEIEYTNFIKSTYGRNLSKFALEIGLLNFDSNFTDFINKYQKQYQSDEVEYRKGNFLYSFNLVHHTNKDFDRGRLAYRLSLNRFSDYGLNDNYFISQKYVNPTYIAKLGASSLRLNGDDDFEEDATTTWPLQSVRSKIMKQFPMNWDWRTKGVVSQVKDQGNCGSCWIFAALSVIESAHAIIKNPLIPLSEQYIMNCVKPPKYVSDGCAGGTVDDVYSFVQNSGAIQEFAFPYFGKPIGTCPNTTGFWKETISKYTFLPINSTDRHIMWALYNKGPLAAVINAGDKQFELYSGGILTTPGNRDLFTDQNHYITIVGWGHENGYDYWLIKNSWGTDWGDGGFAKLLRGINNRGINSIVSYVEAGSQMVDSEACSIHLITFNTWIFIFINWIILLL